MPIYITYRCPQCKRSHQTEAAEDYPDETDVIEFICPDCNPKLNDEVKYYDKDNNLIAIGNVEE
jgi:transposase-like protein